MKRKTENYSTSLHSLIIRRVNFRPVFSPPILTSCFRRVAFGELFSTSFPHTVLCNSTGVLMLTQFAVKT